MKDKVNVHISIGNSDDRLSQHEWSNFIRDVKTAITSSLAYVHGEWYSSLTSQWQNACWALEFNCDTLGSTDLIIVFRHNLSDIARRYEQKSIAWLEGETEFIEP